MREPILDTIPPRYHIAESSMESDEVEENDFFPDALLLLIILRRRRRRRLQLKKRKPKRFWVRDIYLRRKELGEYYNLVKELRLGDREFYYRFVHLTCIYQVGKKKQRKYYLYKEFE